MKGNKEQIGSSNGIGNSDGIGSSDREFAFKKIRGRRDFFDSVKAYVNDNGCVRCSKLVAYFQYTTGASPPLIYEALKVLEELGMVKVQDVNLGSGSYDIEISKVRK